MNVNIVPINHTPPSSSTGMRIGSWNHSTGREYTGHLDDIRIYNRALSATEVRSLYNDSLAGYPSTLNYTSISPLGFNKPVSAHWVPLFSGAGLNLTFQSTPI